MKNSYKTEKINSNLILEYKNLNYITKPFNDQKTIEKWKSLGHNYEKYTGLMRDQSQQLPDWCFNVLEQIPLQKSSITLYCMSPGTIMPEHSDTFIKYREIMNLKETDSVGRAVIFLEDWKLFLF